MFFSNKFGESFEFIFNKLFLTDIFNVKRFDCLICMIEKSFIYSLLKLIYK